MTTFRVALTMGLMAMSAPAVAAAEIPAAPDEVAAEIPAAPDEVTTEIYVVNNHLHAVRVYLEDAEGKLHRIGRLARGDLKAFQVPAELAAQQVRVKVFPATPVWASPSDDYGVKTSLLDPSRDRQVRVWLEPDLSQSIVEVDRG